HAPCQVAHGAGHASEHLVVVRVEGIVDVDSVVLQLDVRSDTPRAGRDVTQRDAIVAVGVADVVDVHVVESGVVGEDLDTSQWVATRVGYSALDNVGFGDVGSARILLARSGDGRATRQHQSEQERGQDH